MLQAWVVQQAQPPPMGLTDPSAPREKEAKTDITRGAACWQLGQVPSSAERFMGRKSSNLVRQFGQKYS